MDELVRKHSTLAAADVDGVIVTLFLFEGFVRGWYIGPPSFHKDVPMSWQTSPADNLHGTIALARAMDIADKLGLQLSIVDPDNLWDLLNGRETNRKRDTAGGQTPDRSFRPAGNA